MAIAFPMTRGAQEKLRDEVLVHIASAAHRDGIITDTGPAGLPVGTNCRIHLKAGQGWSLLPFRLLRDYSVLDPWLTDLTAYGRYTYFFIGEPGWWAMKKNIGPGSRWDALGPDFLVLRIRGEDLLSHAQLFFYRPDDNVLVIRGDYVGPAAAIPAP